MLGRVLDGLAEHQRAVVGERGGELGVDLLEVEGDGRGVGRHDARDIGVDVGHRRAELLAAQTVHRVHDIGGRERLTVTERDAVSQSEGPDPAVWCIPLRRQSRLHGEVLAQRHELLVDLLLKEDVGYGAGKQGRVEVDVPGLRADLEDAAHLDGAGVRAGAAGAAAAGEQGEQAHGDQQDHRDGEDAAAPVLRATCTLWCG